MMPFCHRTQVHRLMAHLAAGDAGQIQQIIDQLRHALGRRANAFKEPLRLRVERSA